METITTGYIVTTIRMHSLVPIVSQRGLRSGAWGLASRVSG